MHEVATRLSAQMRKMKSVNIFLVLTENTNMDIAQYTTMPFDVPVTRRR